MMEPVLRVRGRKLVEEWGVAGVDPETEVAVEGPDRPVEGAGEAGVVPEPEEGVRVIKIPPRARIRRTPIPDMANVSVSNVGQP